MVRILQMLEYFCEVKYFWVKKVPVKKVNLASGMCRMFH